MAKKSFIKKLKNLQKQFKESKNDIQKVIDLGVSSYKDILLMLDSSDDEKVSSICWILGLIGKKKHSKYLLKVISSERKTIWMQVAVALSCIADKKSIEPLIALMLNAKEEKQREAAAYTLSFLFLKSKNKLLTKTFIKVLENETESPAVRAQVEEGLGCILRQNPKKNRLYKKAIKILIKALNDKAVEVRFWSAFALGSIGAKAALPALKELASNDKSVLKGWWAVSDEAKDAIEAINTGCWPDTMRVQQL